MCPYAILFNKLNLNRVFGFSIFIIIQDSKLYLEKATTTTPESLYIYIYI